MSRGANTALAFGVHEVHEAHPFLDGKAIVVQPWLLEGGLFQNETRVKDVIQQVKRSQTRSGIAWQGDLQDDLVTRSDWLLRQSYIGISPHASFRLTAHCCSLPTIPLSTMSSLLHQRKTTDRLMDTMAMFPCSLAPILHWTSAASR